MAKERNCIFCGKSYVYCPNCGNYKSYPEWMFNFDTERCHDLYEVIGGYNMGVNTIEDVKAVLDKYEITDYSEFSKGLQSKLNELAPQKKDEPVEIPKETKNNKIEESYISQRIKKNNKFERRVNTEE